MKKLKLIFIIAAVLCIVGSSPSIAAGGAPGFLGHNNFGTEFWLTVPPCLEENTPGHENYVKIIVTSFTETPVTVEVPSKAYFDKKNTIPFQQIEFSLTPQIAQPYMKSGHDPEVPETVFKHAGIRIKSGAPIGVYVVVRFRQSSDGYLALPVNVLGKEYIVSSYGDGSALYGLFTSMPSLTGIVAAYDNTQIKFTYGGNYVAATFEGFKPGDTVVRTLNRGDVWMLSSKGQESDLTGSRVEASMPVAVISGNQSANIPMNNRWDDYVVEMETPLNAWGLHYHCAPIMKRKFSPVLRVFARYPNTKIYKNGREIATIKTAGGISGEGFLEIPLYDDVNSAQPTVISGDKPINVATYNTGVEIDGYPLPPGAPFQMLLSSTAQYQKEILFSTGGMRGGLVYPEHYVNLIFETSAGGIIPADLEVGIPQAGNIMWRKFSLVFPGVHAELFPTDIEGKQYGLLRFPLPGEGVYAIRAAKPLAAYVYGFSEHESYGYPASLLLSDLDKEDKEPPAPVWNIYCDGTIYGSVTDMPDDPNVRSNLSQTLFLADQSINVREFNHTPVDASTRTANWSLRVSDITKDASAVIVFRDRCNNDTTIQVEYKALKISIKENKLDFGTVKMKDMPVKTFQLINFSDSDVKISRLELKSGLNGFEILDKQLPFIAPAHSEVEFTARFTAGQPGFYSDSLGLGDSCFFMFRTALEAVVGYPEIRVSNISFGDVTVGSVSSQRVVIENTGIYKLVITGYSGPEKSVYKTVFDRIISADQPLEIAPKGYYAFNVEFRPIAEGIVTDSIVFFNDAGRTDSVALISGTGIKPGLVASSFDWGRKRIDRQDFPSGPYEIDNAEGGILIKNDGSAKAVITGYEIESEVRGNAFTFERSELNLFELEPGQSYVLKVKFHPQLPGDYEMVIKFLDKDGSKTRARLQGFGSVPMVTMENVIFDTTVVGDERISSHKYLIIKNLGIDEWNYADTAVIEGIAISPNSSDISLDWENFGQKGFKVNMQSLILPIKLPPNTSLRLDASFKAFKEGESNAEMFLLTDAVANPKSIFKGWGITNAIKAIGGNALVCPGESKIINCEIHNYSSRAVEINNLKIMPEEPEFYFYDPDVALGFSIPPGETKSVLVVFKPNSFIKKTSELVFQSPGASEPEYRVEISGEADRIDRTLSVSPVHQLAVIGQNAECRIYLEDGRDISQLGITEFSVSLKYNSSFLKLTADSLGSLIDGKFFVKSRYIDHNKGELRLDLSSIAGAPLKGKGELLRFQFFVFLPTGDTDISTIDLGVNFKDAECLVAKTNNARIGLKPTCLYDLRKVILSPYTYSLGAVSPNPVSANEANLEFSVGLEGFTEITIYNYAGEMVSKPISGNITAGAYSFAIPTRDLKQGIYFVNMVSGQFSATRKLIILE